MMPKDFFRRQWGDAWTFGTSQHPFGASWHAHILSAGFGKIQVITAKFVILSSEEHGECEIHWIDTGKQFQMLDHSETWVIDARTPPDADVMHRMVQGNTEMMPLMYFDATQCGEALQGPWK